MASIPGAAGPGAKFPQWTYNTVSHQVAEVPNEFAKAAAETATFPDKLIFFTTESAADAYMTSQGGGLDTSHTPLQAAGNAVSAAGQAATSGLPSLWSNFPWLRIGEVVLGLVLIAVGVAKLTNAVPIATTVAKAVS